MPVAASTLAGKQRPGHGVASARRAGHPQRAHLDVACTRGSSACSALGPKARADIKPSRVSIRDLALNIKTKWRTETATALKEWRSNTVYIKGGSLCPNYNCRPRGGLDERPHGPAPARPHVATRRCLRCARPLPRHACEPAAATPVILASLARARLSLGRSRASRRLSADAVGGLTRGI